jgi:hypothetical protein
MHPYSMYLFPQWWDADDRTVFRDLYTTVADNDKNDQELIASHFDKRMQFALMDRDKGQEYVDLANILTRCLRFRPKARPTFDEVLQLIQDQRPAVAQKHNFVENKYKAAWAQRFPLDGPFDADLQDREDAAAAAKVREDAAAAKIRNQAEVAAGIAAALAVSGISAQGGAGESNGSQGSAN